MSLEKDFFDACAVGDVPLVKILLQQSLDHNEERIVQLPSNVDKTKMKDKNRNPFLAACDLGNIEVVKELLKSEKINKRFENAQGVTALHLACQAGWKDIVALLIKEARLESNDINKKDNNGNTPLLVAAQDNCQEVVAYLLNNPLVNIKESNKQNCTSFYIACFKKNEEIFSHFARKYLTLPGKVYLLSQSPLTFLQSLCDDYTSDRKISVVEEDNDFILTTGFKDDKKSHMKISKALLLSLQEEALKLPLFALVIFLSDGLLALKENSENSSEAARFFKIVSMLPIEMQMIICQRVGKKEEDIIFPKESEPHFKDLAKRMTPQFYIAQIIQGIENFLDAGANSSLFSSLFYPAISAQEKSIAKFYRQALVDPSLSEGEKLIIVYALLHFSREDKLKGKIMAVIGIEEKQVLSEIEKLLMLCCPQTPENDAALSIIERTAKKIAAEGSSQSYWEKNGFLSPKILSKDIFQTGLFGAALYEEERGVKRPRTS